MRQVPVALGDKLASGHKPLRDCNHPTARRMARRRPRLAVGRLMLARRAASGRRQRRDRSPSCHMMSAWASPQRRRRIRSSPAEPDCTDRQGYTLHPDHTLWVIGGRRVAVHNPRNRRRPPRDPTRPCRDRVAARSRRRNSPSRQAVVCRCSGSGLPGRGRAL